MFREAAGSIYFVYIGNRTQIVCLFQCSTHPHIAAAAAEAVGQVF